MKKYLFFAVLSLFLTSMLSAQENEINTESPQTGLTEARKEYQEALKKNDSPGIIRALILQYRYQELIDRDAIIPILQEIEQRIQVAPDVEKQILHSVAAEIYHNFSSDNSWKIWQRTPIEGKAPDDILTWSSNIFRDTIRYHALASLSREEVLEKTPINEYARIITFGEESQKLNHTLYDLLISRSIRFCKELFQLTSSFKSDPILNDTLLFCPLQEFLSLDINQDGDDPRILVFHLYQKMLNSQIKRELHPASLITDLDRLEYTYINAEMRDNSNIYYLKVLNLLEEEYGEMPWQVEVMAKRAQLYAQYRHLHRDSENKATQTNKVKAIEICDEGIRRYPGYFRINLLKSIKETLLRPALSATALPYAYPGEEQQIGIASENISSVNYSLYRVNEDILTYRNGKKTAMRREKIFDKKYIFQDPLIRQDTTFRFSMPEIGIYEMVITAQALDGKKREKDTLSIYVSKWSCYLRNSEDNKREVLVCDLMSGQPLKGARVTTYSKKKNQFLPEKEYFSDEYGIAQIEATNDHFYQVSYENDNYGNILSVPYNYRSRETTTREETSLFTDRRTYRPGQTIYFKGISWETTENTTKPITGRAFTVALYNSNNQEIAKTELKSNEYGSFSGSFTLPTDVLNGRFFLRTKNGYSEIKVEEYKRPRLNVTLSPLKTSYRTGDRLTLHGNAKLFSGIGVEGAEVSYTITKNTYHRPYGNAGHKISGKTQTDKEGNFSLSFETSGDDQNNKNTLQWFLLNYTVYVTVTTPQGETQNSSLHIPVSHVAYSIHTNIPEMINKESRQTFEITSLNTMNIAVEKELNYSIKRLKPLSAIGEVYDETNLPIEQEITTGQFLTKNKTWEIDFSSYPSGSYVLELNDLKEEVTHQHLFHLYAPDDSKPPFLTYDWLIEKNTSFSPSSPAEVVIGSSAKDVYVLYEILNSKGKLLERKRFLLSEQNKNLSISYQSSYGEQVYLCLSFVRDNQYFQHNIPLSLEKPDKSLHITTHTFRDRLKPGNSEQWTFTVRDAQGKAVVAEMLAGMYDSSLDLFGRNYWRFNPIPIQNHPELYWNTSSRWEEYTNIVFKTNQWKVPVFRFNILKFLETDRIALLRMRGLSRGAGSYDAAFEEVLELTLGANIDPSFKIATDEAFMVSTEEYSADDESGGIPVTKQQLPSAENTPQIRRNLEETAFFYPQLLTDAEGQVNIRFTVPESTTTWRFMALAHTREMGWGELEKMVITQKEFMVTPNLPRFVRSGDQVKISTLINNLSDQAQAGDAYLELFLPETEKIISKQNLPFRVEAGSHQTIQFEFTAPSNVELLGCRIVAAGSRFSDGEQHLLPVVPNTTLITQTTPIFTTQTGEQQFKITIPKKVSPYRVTLELTANPVWYAVMALPSINEPKSDNITDLSAAYYAGTIAAAIAQANPEISAAIRSWSQSGKPASPLEQNQELKSIVLQLTPWVREAQNETDRMRSLSELLNENRQHYLREQTLLKIRTLQNSDGGWGWMKGFSSNRFITLNMLEIWSSINRLNAGESNAKVKEMQIAALQYLDKIIEKEDKEKLPAGYDQLLYLYTRSSYMDIPLADALEAHKNYLEWFEQHWTTLSLYEKALLATTLHRYGKQEIAQRIVASLREYATTSPEMGMYWANNRSRYYTNSAIQTHVAMLSAFYEVDNHPAEIDAMKQWLLRQKQTQSWGSVPSTVDAIHALLLTGSRSLENSDPLTVTWNREKFTVNTEGNLPGYVQKSYTAGEINSRMETVTLKKTGSQASWGGLYYQYFQPLEEVTQQSNEIRIEKELFVKEQGEQGIQLTPLFSGQKQAAIRPGNPVTVRITIRTEQDMQFVHIRDLRAGCFEPREQLSGNRRQGELFFYEEVKDVATNFFIQFLPKGTHVFEYELWTSQEGVFQDGTATIQCIYAPQYSANSNTVRIRVGEP